MNLAILLLQGWGSGAGMVVGLVFFVVLSITAFLAFWMLRKTLKMAFRMAIVGVILLIAIAGAIAFFALGTGSGSGSSTQRPGTSRQANSR